MYADEYYRAQRAVHLAQLCEFLRIPSVSAQPEHQADMRRAADWLAVHLRQIGMTRVDVLKTTGHPVVYAERVDHPGRPFALVYGHYDVQPAGPLDQWRHPPFEPVIEHNRLYARGAHDDKGQVFMHLKVIEGLIRLEGRLPVNLRVLIEGDEETDSAHVERFVREHRERLRASVAVISDTSLWGRGIPSLTYALRGLASMEVRVQGAPVDFHSGMYGGAVPNAVHALVGLLASLRQPDGKIAVDGFYDQVKELTAEERTALADLGLDEAALMHELGLQAFHGEPGYSFLERTWARPTLEVNGIWGGYQGPGSKTIVPSVAGAKITCRLVPDQEPERVLDAVERHLRVNCPPGMSLSIHRGGGSPACVIPLDHPAVVAAREAFTEVYGTETRLIRAGGSIPVVGMLASELGMPSLLMGFGLKDENMHAPNEFFDLENFDLGLRVLHRFWIRLAGLL